MLHSVSCKCVACILIDLQRGWLWSLITKTIKQAQCMVSTRETCKDKVYNYCAGYTGWYSTILEYHPVCYILHACDMFYCYTVCCTSVYRVLYRYVLYLCIPRVVPLYTVCCTATCYSIALYIPHSVTGGN